MHSLLVLFAQRRQDPDFGPVELAMVAVYLGIFIVFIAGAWKMCEKAGEPGWSQIIPFYNIIVLGRMAGLSGLWIFLNFVPCIGIIANAMLNIKLAERFGKDAGFGVAAFFLPFICYPILGFGGAEYERPLTTREVLARKSGPPDFSNFR